MGFLGPADGDVAALGRGAEFLLNGAKVHRAVYLGIDGALDRAVAAWARKLVGDDPSDRAAWTRSAAVAISGKPAELDRFVAEARHDLINAGGFLVIGAAIAASVNVLAPRSWLQAISDHPVLSVAFMAIFAVAIAMCSEADAFVAASMTGFSPTAQLVFMVVGPVIDVKLFAMQLVTFGRRFVVVFAPLTLSVAVIVAVVVGRFLS